MSQIVRNCDSDCTHSKACDADYTEKLQEAGEACVDCGYVFARGLDTFYGAGDGTGRSFRCGNCHNDANRKIEWSDR